MRVYEKILKLMDLKAHNLRTFGVGVHWGGRTEERTKPYISITGVLLDDGVVSGERLHIETLRARVQVELRKIFGPKPKIDVALIDDKGGSSAPQGTRWKEYGHDEEDVQPSFEEEQGGNFAVEMDMGLDEFKKLWAALRARQMTAFGKVQIKIDPKEKGYVRQLKSLRGTKERIFVQPRDKMSYVDWRQLVDIPHELIPLIEAHSNSLPSKVRRNAAKSVLEKINSRPRYHSFLLVPPPEKRLPRGEGGEDEAGEGWKRGK